MRRHLWPISVYLFLSLVLTGAIWWWAYGSALDRLAERGQTELSLASDRLLGQLQRFRQLAVVMADHPGLTALLSEDSDQFLAEADRLLLRTADKTGSYEIFVAAASGRVVASSRMPSTLQDVAGDTFFQRAMYGALGTAQTQKDEETGRAFYFAAPIKHLGEIPIGAVVVKVDIEAVETDWRADPNILFFTDNLGVVFVTNRVDLLFNAQGDVADIKRLNQKKQKYDSGVLVPFPSFNRYGFAGHELWGNSEEGVFPATSLHLVHPLPVVALRSEILLDTTAASVSAALQAAVAGAFCLVVGAGFLIMLQRRAALAERLLIEETANHVLEDRVARRTEQLSGVNLDLREQIHERTEAEAALKKAQQDLVQAGKLSALGQMSAGISHELNQPLMAIRSFAENAELFLNRGQTDTARANLARISDLARRMGRIIKNLRAFSRKEGEPMTDVNLCDVVTAALELTDRRMRDQHVLLEWQPPDPAIYARGGEVRLQQVLVNLISNALDAMETVAPVDATHRIEIMIEKSSNTTCLSVRDTGPGLSEPEKIFDPFYSTKSVGQAEGMGLGLSISYGIVQSFGGKISGRNHPKGGSVFTVELTPTVAQVAA